MYLIKKSMSNCCLGFSAAEIGLGCYVATSYSPLLAISSFIVAGLGLQAAALLRIVDKDERWDQEVFKTNQQERFSALQEDYQSKINGASAPKL